MDMERFKLRTLATIAFSLLLSTNVSFAESGSEKSEDAKKDVTSFWANTIASRISQIKKPEHLVHPSISKKSRDMITKEIKDKKISFEVPKVELLENDSVALKFKSRTVTLGFDRFANRKVTLEGRVIELADFKTFYNYRAEVELILNDTKKKKAFLEFFVPEAHAQYSGPRDFIAGVVTNIGGYGAKDLTGENTRDASLATVIIQAYQNEVNSAHRFAQDTGDYLYEDTFWQTLTFRCERNQVSRVAQQVVVMDGEVQRNQTMVEISRGADGNWSRRNRAGQVTRADRNGFILGANGRPTSQNLFGGAPVYRFHQIADRCCRVNSCAQRVHDAFDSMAEGLAPAGDNPGRSAR